MGKSKSHTHVYASNLDTPPDELQCRDCDKVVDLETGKDYNTKHHYSHPKSGAEKSSGSKG